MGLFDFIKDVGKKMGFAEDNQINVDDLINEVKKNNLDIEDLEITQQESKIIVSGKVKSQEIREKVILTLGNVNGVSQIEDNISVEKEEQDESIFYTVKKGDTLSKISKEQYGDPMKYMVIFEANKPMLSDPDKIYPGQVLRIPSLEK